MFSEGGSLLYPRLHNCTVVLKGNLCLSLAAIFHCFLRMLPALIVISVRVKVRIALFRANERVKPWLERNCKEMLASRSDKGLALEMSALNRFMIRWQN